MKKRDLAFLKKVIDQDFPDGEIPSLHDHYWKYEVPEKPGAYILLSHGTRFIYPHGTSKVVYVGMSSNLKNRIDGHFRNLTKIRSIYLNQIKDYWYYSRYNYLDRFGCKLYWFVNRKNETPKELESLIIEAFYSRYHSLPIGNGAFSF